MGLNGKNREQPQSIPHPRSSSPRTYRIELDRLAQELADEIRVIAAAQTVRPRRENNEQHQRDLEEYEHQNPPRRRRFH